jgi:hypothetical protein
MVNIDMLSVGQLVQLDGEQGRIKKIDYDDNIVWVGVQTPKGEMSVDVSPDEPWFAVIQ